MTGRLFRSRSDRMLFGVSGGLADQLDVDPTFVRLGWIALGFITAGVAILAYVVLAIVVPEESAEAGSGAAGSDEDTEVEASRPDGSNSSGRRRGRGFGMVVGALLIVLGVLFLGVNLDLFAWIDWGIIWPVVLILLGVLLIARRYRSG